MPSSRSVADDEMFLSRPAPVDSPTVKPLRIFKPQTTPQPTFPLPPGASSSAAPLPFPDDDDVRKPTLPRPYGAAWQQSAPRLDTAPQNKKPGLAERRGASPKVIHSPSSPDTDDGLFARPIRPADAATHGPSEPLWHDDQGVNRIASTASNFTTKASRGSPPPPETPVAEPGDSIEARYAASGIAGTATLHSLQTQQPAEHAGKPHDARRPWTPTEAPGQAPCGPPTVYQGLTPISTSSPSTFAAPPAQTSGNSALQVSVLEQDFQRLGTKTPPPAYSSLNSSTGSSYPNEKRHGATSSAAAPASTWAPAPASASGSTPAASPPHKPASTAALASPAVQHPGHPAFANDARPQSIGQASHPTLAPSLAPQTPASPPPLPEGWIAHLDQNSGQYYYIHLATQATQWEFPKGPNPIQHEQAPLSPAASTYGNPLTSPAFGKQSLASPMFSPHTPGYAESIMSIAASQTPTAAGFSGPPPSSGVDMYRVQPSNGVYFGPYLRYVNMDVEKGTWYGSILAITDAPQPPTIHMHQSQDLSPNPRQLHPQVIYTHQRWIFYKYDIDVQMGQGGTERWTYAVTSHLGCTRYEFVVAGRGETGWRFIAHSGNDFATSTSQNERARLGGVGFMWKDVLQKNIDCGGFHVQLGLGDQIYGDRLWREVPLLKQWLAMSGRDNKKNAQWTARHEEDVSHAYFHFYTSHFDQPFLREAFAQIPHVLQINDHDIFDGYGSYPAYMQASPMFKNIGRIATDMYLLFQHHTTVEVMRNVSTDRDIFTVTGTGWHFVKFLGPAVVVVGPDCRSERTQGRVMAGPTYQGLFPKVASLPPSVQHVVWMMSVPLVYPRLDTVESLANTVAAGKKAVNTTYNILGKVTSSVAGVVGGKEVVAQGFNQVKKAVGKTGLMGNVLNQFGELDIHEVLKDLWTHETKDLERTYLIRTLQGIAQQKGIRMTFLSGGKLPSRKPTIIASPIVASPQAGYVLRLLHNQRSLYVPQNGHKSTHEVSDTKEDMMEIFHTDASGASRELKKLMGRRNYVALVAYDQDTIGQAPFSPNPNTSNTSHHHAHQALSPKLSLAVDFVVQGDGAFQSTTKYGPVIIPHLEYGR
ncbi:hypothetical protein CDD82_5456 [Ophiocordyceps australis]|uniref:WW domain-containing protein n=1 Tax=Ophiocordyceps australis TaxID=1399860 RepID=A0A2C5ZRX5_9HYPO|nr:hypothetical protein CDD82_5456 [Ophiocordyceps australis]